MRQIFVSLLLSLSVCLAGCTSGENRQPGFNELVEAFTSGNISKKAPVTIVFRDTIPVENRNGEFLRSVIRISPAAELDFSVAQDGRTLKMTPRDELKGAGAYEVSVKMPELFRNEQAAPFAFHFSVFSPDAVFEWRDMEVDRDGRCVFTAEITTRDNETDEAVESAVRIPSSNPVEWIHSAGGTRHKLVIKEVLKKENDTYDFTVEAVKNKIGLKTGRFSVPVPAAGKFYLYDKRFVAAPERYVELIFSEQIDSGQNLDGLVELSGTGDVPVTVDGNRIRLYVGRNDLPERTEVAVDASLRSREGTRLGVSQTVAIETYSGKPAVRFAGKSVILPENDSVNMAFQTINLRAVRVKVIRIYENNIGEFLQSNDLSDYSELSRVGTPVACKTIFLDGNVGFDPDKWTTYSLNLKELTDPERGAIYHVELSFDRRFSTYDCGRDITLSPAAMADEDAALLQKDLDNFGRGGYYYYDSGYDWSDYDWSQRDNPCSNSYYVNRNVSKNIMVSNLALIAKSGDDGTMRVVANNILTGGPEEMVEIRVYNYQNRLLAKGVTDASGAVDLVYEGAAPYYIAGAKEKQRAYLRVDNASALSLSNFDVWGEKLQKGIQGYLYGERGVWRPGDTLHLNLVIRDRFGKIPEGHPASFRIVNPLGQVYLSRTVQGINRFYTFEVPTSPEVPTGTWSVTATVGGAVFQKNVRIETVKPNRLKIDLKSPALLQEGLNRLSLRTGWLTGAVAKNLRYNIKGDFSAAVTSFDGYDGYVFDDPAKSFSGEQVELAAGTTDDSGAAVIPLELQIGRNAPGMLDVSLITRVYEQSGEFSINGLSVKYSPYAGYAGVKPPVQGREYLETGKDYTFGLVNLKPDGKPVGNGTLYVSVYKVKWYWWWSNNRNELADYLSDSYRKPVISKKVRTDARGKSEIVLNMPDKDWGTYFIAVTDPESGHTAAVMTYFSDNSTAGELTVGDEAMMLMLKTDKQKYHTGEKVTVSFPATQGAEAIVSLESGTQILQSSRIKCDGTTGSFSFKTTADMLPNVYVYVTLVQPYGAVKNDLPVRLYGVIPVMVESEDTRLEPVVAAPEQVKPMTKFDITVSEKNGRPMTYTLAIVDVGLLDLTNFKTPDPWNAFYARQALGINTWDSYNYIFGAYGGKIEQMFSIGGDAMAAARNAASANRFKPVSIYLGTFTLGKNKKQTHAVEIPNFAGTVRVMVVASDDEASGCAEKEIKVVNPVMVLASLPRILSPGDIFFAGATVFAMEEKIGDVAVSLQAAGQLRAEGAIQEKVRMTAKGDTTVYFKMKAKDTPGTGSVRLDAVAPAGRSYATTEIGIRSVDIPVSTSVTRNVQAGDRYSETLALPGKPGTNRMLVEVSRIPAMNLGARLEYLADYPYACVEQLVSGAFPLLYAGMLTTTEPAVLRGYEARIKSVLSRLVNYQTADGLLSYWPGGTDISSWGSIYAAHFMLEAAARGFSVPSSLRYSLLSRIRSAARDWQYQNTPYSRESMLVQAYRLYVLALDNNSETGAMNRLYENPSLSGTARWMLAAAYAQIGRKETAEDLLAGATGVDDAITNSLTYGDANRNLAILLLANLGVNNGSKATELAYQIAGTLSSDRWLSTQSTAFSLMAMSKYVLAYPVASDMQFELSVDGKTFDTGDTKDRSILSFTPDLSAAKQVAISFVNKGDGSLFVNVWLEGMATPQEVQAYSNGIAIERRFVDRDGKDVSFADLPQGTDFYSEITVRNTSVYELRNLALREMIPAGWEIGSTLFGTEPASGDISYRDIRDDSAYSFIDRLPVGARVTVRTPLTATYRGTFYMPAVRCEAMYEHEINANTGGTTVTVR